MKENIRYTRSQQIGILLLLGLIIVLQVVIINLDSLFPSPPQASIEIDPSLQKQYDSLKQIAIEKKKVKIYPFNPNYLSAYKAYFLGINLDALNRIEAYRKQGKYFQSKEEFKKISGISDSLFRVLVPYINIPKFTKYPGYSNKPRNPHTKNINRASAEDLQTISGIGPVLSQRILNYRKSLGGFQNKKEIENVYGLEKEVVDRLWKVFYLDPKEVKVRTKKDLNTASMEELEIVNGIGEKLAERIITLRDKNGGFAIRQELNTVYGLKPEVIERIWSFFEIKTPKKISHKISLNDSNIKELAAHPYISYSLAKKIVSYRTLKGGFNSFDELLEVPDFPKNKLTIIRLYLKLD